MLLNLRFEFEGHVVARTMSLLRTAVTDLRPAWVGILEEFRASQRALFASEGQEAGGWEPLSTAYARWKARHYPGQRILSASGRLRAAASGASSELQVISQPMLLAARVTTPYAAAVDRRRDIAPMTDARRRRWLRIVNDHILRAARQGAAA